MIRFPNCKINLGLYVTGRRSDGYHNIETVFYPVPIHDVLEILESEDGRFHFTATGIPIPGDPMGNLCVKAYRLLENAFKIPPVMIHLHKVIPMGSGLGGGSSDGAFAISMIDELYGLNAGHLAQMEFAAQLGSDCPFFLNNIPCYATGRGEILEPVTVSLNGYHLLVVIPDVQVSTAMAYQMVTPGMPAVSLRSIMLEPVDTWAGRLINDFERPVAGRYQVIAGLRSKLKDAGAIYTSMSGSGSAVYGIFRELPDLVFSEHLFAASVRL